jgi:Flp pilus assembly protein protease CpaA
MIASLVILLNAIVLVWCASYVDLDGLRIAAWVLAVIFLVSFIQSLMNRYGKD